MTYNALFSEQYLLIGQIVGQAGTAERTSGWLDMSKCSRVAVGFQPINMTVNAMVVVQEATTSAGARGATITGKITTILAADTAPTIIEISASELTPGFRYIRVVVTPASVSAVTYGVMVLGRVEELPAYTTDLERVVN